MRPLEHLARLVKMHRRCGDYYAVSYDGRMLRWQADAISYTPAA
jgi:hypothetical protein